MVHRLIAIDLKELFEAEWPNVGAASTPRDALHPVDEIVLSAAILDFGPASDDKVLIQGFS